MPQLQILRGMIELPHLIDPLTVKGYLLKNRIVLPPMQIRLATSDGMVTDELISHYVHRLDGLGFLIVEQCYISVDGKLVDKQIGIDNNRFIPGLARLVRKIHTTNIPVVVQINHDGPTTRKEVTGVQPVAPSPSKSARALHIEELDIVIDNFAKAAERAIKAGFDGVEVHGAHNSLLNQFFSPLTNKRQDEYGGSLENRMKLPIEIIERIKIMVGDKLLLYRIGVDDLDPLGTTIEQAQEFAMKLEAAGVDILDISGGLCGSRPPQLQNNQGYFIPQANKIKQVVDIPVIGVGGVIDPDYANQIIHEEQVDLIAVGRALLKDPDWAKNAINQLSE